jgi:hypothetical protein
MGLDVCINKKQIEIYNDGGINSVLRSKGLEDLYWVFGVKDEYHIHPDWQACKQRIGQLRTQYQSVVTDGWKGKYNTTWLGHNMFLSETELPASEKDALELFGQELERWSKQEAGSFDSYGNRVGTFWKNGLKIVGAIPGMRYSSPGLFIITEREKETDDWYAQALEITEEMINYVLSRPDPEKYVLHWSA